ncbi:LicD family-domain-containing protein [Lipomyces oligophaga]|uniref:LicD family-domain-containing protein n=1 Tax=Lipomyces oligophaga TaxID=45792 RepID=UPI0034CEF04A
MIRRSNIVYCTALLLVVTGLSTLLTAFARFDPSSTSMSPMSITHELFYLAPPPAPATGPPKYYSEPQVKNQKGKGWHGLHYDKRYFKRDISKAEREERIRMMLHAWLQFNEDYGLQTWIAHGTLLGWWWNGQPMPWDVDVDVQMFVKTMAELAKHHNGTTYTYRHSDGTTRKYYIDINPYFIYRTKGNGLNVIDGRFVEQETGIYIDLTALAEVDPVGHPNIISCKNNHKYLIDDIIPLRQATFMGRSVLIPYEYEKVLMKEYSRRALTNGRFEGYAFSVELQKWITIEQFNQEHRPWSDVGRGPVTAPNDRLSVTVKESQLKVPGARALSSRPTAEEQAQKPNIRN